MTSPKIEMKFETTVIQIITKTDAQGVVTTDSKTLASSTAGPEETAAILVALADRVRGAKKAFGFNTLVSAFTTALKEEDQKRKDAGKPTLGEEFKEMLAGGKATTTRK